MTLLNEVGVAYIHLSDYGMAIMALTNVIECSVSKDVHQNNESTSSDLVQVWQNLAECYVLQKDSQLATSALRSALRIQQELRDRWDTMDPPDSQPMPILISARSIVQTLRRLSTTLADQEMYSASTNYLVEALLILQNEYSNAQELAKSDSSVDLLAHRDEIAGVLYCMADVKKLEEEYSEAIKLYRESIQLRTKNDRQRSRTGNKKTNHIHCAMALAGIGSVQMQRKEHVRAFKTFNQAIQYVRMGGLPQHPLKKILWEESRAAASKMNKDAKA